MDARRRFERTFWWAATCSAAALPDGVHFVVGLDNGEVRLYHVDGTLVHAFQGHTKWVWAVSVTPDGQHIISGSADKLVKVWSVASKILGEPAAGDGEVSVVAAMPDGQRFLSGAVEGNPGWGLDGTLKNTFSWLHERAVRTLALPDNQHALSGSRTLLSSSSTSTTATSCALSSTTRHVTSLRCSWRPPLRQRLGGLTARIACTGSGRPCAGGIRSEFAAAFHKKPELED